jgi:hypothetical protein
MTRQDLIDEAMLIATAGLGNENFPLRDDPAVADLLVPQAIRRLSVKLATMPDYRHLTHSELELTFANGVADVPAAVLPEMFGESVLRIPDDVEQQLASRVVQWVPNAAEFAGWQERGFWYGLVRSGKIELRDYAGPLEDGPKLMLDCAQEISDAALSDLPAALETLLVTMLAKILRDLNEVDG